MKQHKYDVRYVKNEEKAELGFHVFGEKYSFDFHNVNISTNKQMKTIKVEHAILTSTIQWILDRIQIIIADCLILLNYINI